MSKAITFVESGFIYFFKQMEKQYTRCKSSSPISCQILLERKKKKIKTSGIHEGVNAWQPTELPDIHLNLLESSAEKMTQVEEQCDKMDSHKVASLLPLSCLIQAFSVSHPASHSISPLATWRCQMSSVTCSVSGLQFRFPLYIKRDRFFSVYALDFCVLRVPEEPRSLPPEVLHNDDQNPNVHSLH